MGQTLASRAQWTSVSEHGKGKLGFTPQNEALLNDLVRHVESLVSKNPREAETSLKEAFKWHSTLKPDDFGSLNFGSLGFEVRYVSECEQLEMTLVCPEVILTPFVLDDIKV